MVCLTNGTISLLDTHDIFFRSMNELSSTRSTRFQVQTATVVGNTLIKDDRQRINPKKKKNTPVNHLVKNRQKVTNRISKAKSQKPGKQTRSKTMTMNTDQRLGTDQMNKRAEQILCNE